MAYCDKIKTLRNGKGFTLDQLAELAGCSKSYIWELENKNPPRPSAEKLSSIAITLGVTLDYLMCEDSVESDAVDRAFYSVYLRTDVTTKKKLRDIFEILT